MHRDSRSAISGSRSPDSTEVIITDSIQDTNNDLDTIEKQTRTYRGPSEPVTAIIVKGSSVYVAYQRSNPRKFNVHVSI